MNDWAEFRHFKYLLAVMEHEGFRAAAEHLRTSEPNLSVQAKQFQETFSIQLFRRRKDGRIQLTETGIAFKQIARGLLEARDEAIAALIAIERGEIGTLNLGCEPFVDPEIFRAACKLYKDVVPNCSIRPTNGQTTELLEELASGEIDAAILIQPVSSSLLHVVPIRRDRLVVCLRSDHPLATKTVLHPSDLKDHLAVFYRGHPTLREFLEGAGLQIRHFSRASHPAELQSLVKAGYGFALIRENTALETELTTRPIVGVNWSVDTAFVYRRERHLKIVPVLAGRLRRRFLANSSTNGNGPQTLPTQVTSSATRNAHPAL